MYSRRGESEVRARLPFSVTECSCSGQQQQIKWALVSYLAHLVRTCHTRTHAHTHLPDGDSLYPLCLVCVVQLNATVTVHHQVWRAIGWRGEWGLCKRAASAVNASNTAYKWREEWSATAALLSLIASPLCPHTLLNLWNTPTNTMSAYSIPTPLPIAIPNDAATTWPYTQHTQQAPHCSTTGWSHIEGKK